MRHRDFTVAVTSHASAGCHALGIPPPAGAYSFPVAKIFAKRKMTIAIKTKILNTITRTNS
jgi:hypothetical protein